MISRIQVLCSKRTVAHLQQHGEKRYPHINLNRCLSRFARWTINIWQLLRDSFAW